nr:hypothetical protein [Sciscionella sp. SE31]
MGDRAGGDASAADEVDDEPDRHPDGCEPEADVEPEFFLGQPGEQGAGERTGVDSPVVDGEAGVARFAWWRTQQGNIRT